MAKQNGRAGKSTHEMAGKRRTSMLGMGIVGIIALIIVGVAIQNAKAWGIGGFAFLFLFMLLPLIPRITNRFMAGEEGQTQAGHSGGQGETGGAGRCGWLWT